MDTYGTRFRTTSYGVAYDDPRLDVSCGTCKALEGHPCDRRGGGFHTTRTDKAHLRHFKAAHKLAMQREREELAQDPDGKLWRALLAHRCGTLGAHEVPTDCSPVGGAA